MDNIMNGKLEEIITESGACEYKIVEESDIIFSENVRLLCEEEVRLHGESSWSMPPAVGTYEECLARCKQYKYAILFSTIAPATDIANFDEWMEAAMLHNEMTIQMAEKLKEYVKDLMPLGVRCRRCDKCAYPDAECRNPQTLLPSTESYGIHIMETMKAQDICEFYDAQTIVCFGVIFFN